MRAPKKKATAAKLLGDALAQPAARVRSAEAATVAEFKIGEEQRRALVAHPASLGEPGSGRDEFVLGLDNRRRPHFRAGHGDPLGHHGDRPDQANREPQRRYRRSLCVEL
jgi:hypothetical protein